MSAASGESGDTPARDPQKDAGEDVERARESGPSTAPANTPLALLYRPMRDVDLPQVLAIEEMAYEFPWTEGIFRDCLRMGYHCYVAEQGRRLVAYGILSIGAGESHLLNLCVHPHHRRRGVARKLLAFLMDKARSAGVDSLILEVRPSNTAAIQLYRSLGFNEVGRRRDYYPARGGREDALILALEF